MTALAHSPLPDPVRIGSATLVCENSISWLLRQPPRSVHAVVTDPPYAVTEYEPEQVRNLREGNGRGVWRVPPTLNGQTRSPLPRFTTLTPAQVSQIDDFFASWAEALAPVLTPGAHVFIAANPLISHRVAAAVERAGLERRGEIVRLVQTMRGGDRPKGHEEEFSGVTVMPRSQWEPWLVFRAPLEGTVAETLRRWGTGGLRRLGPDQPFGDVIKSHPTHAREKRLAAHPSLKPQSFLRPLVAASLPLGRGVVLDCFAGSGSTLAAANAVGYESIGVERDVEFFDLAAEAIPRLARYVPYAETSADSKRADTDDAESVGQDALW